MSLSDSRHPYADERLASRTLRRVDPAPNPYTPRSGEGPRRGTARGQSPGHVGPTPRTSALSTAQSAVGPVWASLITTGLVSWSGRSWTGFAVPGPAGFIDRRRDEDK